MVYPYKHVKPTRPLRPDWEQVKRAAQNWPAEALLGLADVGELAGESLGRMVPPLGLLREQLPKALRTPGEAARKWMAKNAPALYQETTGPEAALTSLVNPLALLGPGVARQAARAARDVGPAMASRALERLGPLQAMSPQHVVKPRGGQWVEPGLMKYRYLEEQEAEGEALQKWIDRQLRRYIMTEMGTPEDPIRKLWEEGVYHVAPENLTGFPSVTKEEAKKARMKFMGTPKLMGKTPEARKWEETIDRMIGIKPAETLIKHQPNVPEWMKRLDPETPIYTTFGITEPLQYIEQALMKDMLSGQLKPESLSRISIADAVHRANRLRLEKLAEAEKGKRTLATKTIKEYPEQGGMQWVEIGRPEGVPEKEAGEAVAKALKAEGALMKHCVGSYCPAVMAGKTKIFSLRDAKGNPHATVEIMVDPGKPPKITQIKGKANIKPKKQYHPFIEDFITSQGIESVSKKAWRR